MATKNIVPNSNGEGSIGTAAKGWGGAFLTSTATSSTSAGAKLQLISNDGAVMADTHQLGIIEFLGAEDGSGTISLGASIEAVADETFTASENASALVFKTTSGTTVSEVLRLDKDKNATIAGALTVSGAGNSAFSGPVFISHSSGDSLTLTKDTTEPSLRFEGDSNKDFVITVSGELLTFTQNDGSTDILTLDHDTKNATFAGNIAVTGSDPELTATNVFKLISNGGDIGFRARATSTPANGVYYFGGTNANPFITPAVTIMAGGDINAHTGNIIMGTAGKGIDFSAESPSESGAGAVSSSILDDYEEGTWTPTVVSDNGNVAVSNSTYTKGFYTKIGRMVHCSGQIVLTSLNSGTGSVEMGGYPFINQNLQGAQSGGVCAAGTSLNITAGQSVFLVMRINEHNAGFSLTDSTGGTTEMQGSEFSDNGQVQFSITYMTDS